MTLHEALLNELGLIPLIDKVAGTPLETAIYKAMINYAASKCQEQRSICAAQADNVMDADGNNLLYIGVIINSPEPNYD
jgi:hypothetical protein